jgi:hypothetical protein
MPNVDVDLTFSSEFGEQGVLDGQFQYPYGCCIFNEELYVCDRQNNRIQVFTLAGVFVRQFDCGGTLALPEAIVSDGVWLFICNTYDTGNHKHIVKSNTDGTVYIYVDTAHAYYTPVDIKFYNNTLYICDRGYNTITARNRYTFALVNTFGNTGSGDQLLKLPEGIEIFEGYIVVSDSGNKKIKVFSISGIFMFSIPADYYDYPIGLAKLIEATNEVALTCVDTAGHRLVFYDDSFAYGESFGSQGATQDHFYFPRQVLFYDEKLYIIDSGNHRVQIYSVVLTLNVPRFVEILMRLTKQLYPTGRAFWLSGIVNYYRMHEGLAYSESRAVEKMRSILYSILPDNENFSEEDAMEWERALGIMTNTELSLTTRKQTIYGRMQFPGSDNARLGANFLTIQLQNNGFDVYVKYNTADSGTSSDPTGYDYTIIANSIDETEDADFFSGQSDPENPYATQLKATFFVCGEGGSSPNWDRAEVEEDRKKEFRELLLKIKPAWMVGFLYIDYV